MTHDEAVKETARRLNLPYEQVRILFVDFYHQLLMHLQHPQDNFTSGVLLRNSLKITLNPNKVLKSLKNSKLKNHDTEFSRNLETLHQQLINADVYTQRQKDIIKTIEGANPQGEPILDQDEAEDET